MSNILTAIDMAIGKNATENNIFEIAKALKEHEVVIDPVIDNNTQEVHIIIISELDHFTMMKELAKTGKIYSSVVAAKGSAETISRRLDLYYMTNGLHYEPFNFNGVPEAIYIS